MESEVNVNYKELWGPKPGHQLLTNQLQRLCMVLDVYLETEPHDPSVEGPKEFPQEKMCLRLVRSELGGRWGGEGLGRGGEGAGTAVPWSTAFPVSCQP